MSRRSESEETNSISWLNAGYSQAPESNNPGTKEWCCMEKVESFWQRKDEISPYRREFGVPAVHRVSGERRIIAEVFQSVSAVGASSIRSPNPGHPHPCSSRQDLSLASDNLTGDLMSGHYIVAEQRQFSLGDMEISPANTTCVYPKFYVSRRFGRLVSIDYAKRPVADRSRFGENGGFHSIRIWAGELAPCSNMFSFRRPYRARMAGEKLTNLFVRDLPEINVPLLHSGERLGPGQTNTFV
jgi:hypothetical protein